MEPQNPERTKPPVLNIANAITIVRVLLVPVMVVLFFSGSTTTRLLAAIVFVVAALTDKLDGHLARSRGLETSFGAIVDPIADKALVLSALAMLSIAGDLPWWVTVVIAARELGITVLRFFMLRRAVMAASKGGKLKTALQSVAIPGFLVPWDALVPATVASVVFVVSWVVLAAAVVVTVVTAVDYIVSAWRIAAAARAQEPLPS